MVRENTLSQLKKRYNTEAFSALTLIATSNSWGKSGLLLSMPLFNDFRIDLGVETCKGGIKHERCQNT